MMMRVCSLVHLYLRYKRETPVRVRHSLVCTSNWIVSMNVNKRVSMKR
jgi:hypothetical protein